MWISNLISGMESLALHVWDGLLLTTVFALWQFCWSIGYDMWWIATDAGVDGGNWKQTCFTFIHVIGTVGLATAHVVSSLYLLQFTLSSLLT
jgi:hypothetical protein